MSPVASVLHCAVSPPRHVRSVCLPCAAVCSFEAAEADCNAVLAFPQLAPENQAKALLRRGTARIHKSEVAAAAADFRQVLALEPNNRQAREELKVSGGGGWKRHPTYLQIAFSYSYSCLFGI